MDFINKAAMPDGAAAKAKIDGDIITQTLDTFNSSSPTQKKKSYGQESMKESYDFQKSVLSSAYLGKGTILDGKE